jgi:hypothetical protein
MVSSRYQVIAWLIIYRPIETCSDTQEYTGVHRSTQEYTGVHRSTQEY